MLKIDCLLLNTDYIDGVKKYMKYLGADMMEEHGEAPFDPMFRRMLKEGLELDIESAGLLYSDAFGDKEGFTSMEDVHHESTREFAETARNILLDDVETDSEGKEKKIGDLSPTKNIARRLIRAFKGDNIADNSTKSTLRQIQDWYADTLGRMTEKGEKEPVADTRTWEQKIEEGLEKMKVGERDVDGAILNLETLHKDIDKQLKELTDDLRAQGKDLEAAQWEQYTKSFEDAVYSIALNKKEARDVVEGALIKKGYAKINKKGETVIDWDKVSSHTNSVQQIRENVVEALKDAGHPENVAERVADNLQREFIEAKTRMLEVQDAKRQRAKQPWTKNQTKQPAPDVNDTINEAVREWENYKKLSGDPDAPLIMSKKTAKDVLAHVMKELGLVTNQNAKNPSVSIDKLSELVEKPQDIRDMVRDYLTDKKNFTPEQADAAAEAMSDLYSDMIDRAKSHVQGVVDAVEESWQPKTTPGKTPPTIESTIDRRLKDLEKYNGLSTTQITDIPFKKSEARNILSEALKHTEEFGRDVGGNKQLDWKKLSTDKPSAAQMRDIVEAYLTSIGYEDTAEQIAQSIDRIYPEMEADITRHAEGILQARENADLRKSPERKSALGTLAELNALGAFDNAKQRLLDKAIGVSDITTQDLAQIQEIAEAYSKASAETGPLYGDYLQTTMERGINEIVARNQNSKSKLLKVARFMHNWFSLHNFTLIAGPFNLLQNLTSGMESIVAANSEVARQTGSKKFKDSKLWWTTLKDVAMGAPSGDASAKFGYTQAMDKLNTLNFKENPLKALGTSAVVMYRAALNGMDAANKAVIRNKAFVVNVHEALVRQGWTKSDATDFVYEMMYGKNKDAVMRRAEKIIATYGDQMGVGKSDVARKRAAERLADDMVKANIELGTELGYSMGAREPITTSTVESAIKAAKHGAGVALGHEANNMFSRGQQEARKSARARYDQYIKQGEYGEAAWQSMKNTVWYDGVLRLAVGGANWTVLAMEATGLRLIKAVPRLKEVNAKPWDVSDPKALERAMTQRMEYQKQITRGIIGLSKAAVILGGLGLLGSVVRDEDEGVVEAASKEIEKSNALSKIFKRIAGPIGLIAYLNGISKGQEEGKALASAMEFVVEVSNSNPAFTPAGKLVRAQQQARKGDTDKATGTAGTILGDIWPGTPIVPAYTKLYDLGKEVFTGQAPQYNPDEYPLGFGQGYFYKGLGQKVATNVFSDDMLEALGWENWAKTEK